ncbi:hypothetical protein WDJ51_04375 [Rathayibacter sp. YIM 133350]|uniref:DUF7144 family membrane protein n=1 Tax=Rathayibacter sp. YIM 133350 TaxID=3131992 RepID=UPI00307F6EA5
MSGVNTRPGGVTFIAVLIWIQGALDVLGGVLLLIAQGVEGAADPFGGPAGLITSAIVSILLGLIIIVVARGLLRGSRGARTVVTVIEVLTLLSAVFLAFAAPAQFLSSVLTGLIALVVILLLWTGRAASFFRG